MIFSTGAYFNSFRYCHDLLKKVRVVDITFVFRRWQFLVEGVVNCDQRSRGYVIIPVAVYTCFIPWVLDFAWDEDRPIAFFIHVEVNHCPDLRLG